MAEFRWSAILLVIVLWILGFAFGCNPAAVGVGVQPNYCVQFTLANYTYNATYFADNVTYSTKPSFERDVNVGFGKAVQYDILRVLQAKGLCERIRIGSVECFRPGTNSSLYLAPLLKVHLKLATSLYRVEFYQLLTEMYLSPLLDPTFYRLNGPPELTDATQIGGRCGCF